MFSLCCAESVVLKEGIYVSDPLLNPLEAPKVCRHARVQRAVLRVCLLHYEAGLQSYGSDLVEFGSSDRTAECDPEI